MPKKFSTLLVGIAFACIAAFAQTKPAQPQPSFEVATVKPAQPLDQAKMLAALQNGSRLPVGVTVDDRRAEYLYLDLKTLIASAYGMRPYQIAGPDWMSTTRFDIVAKLPDGAKKEDAPKMLQTLLEDRFGLTAHRTSIEHPVMALIVGKGGPRLKPSAGKPVAIDPNAPLQPGERQMDGPDGPVRVRLDIASATFDLGLKGKMSYKVIPATRSMHIDFSMTTLGGLADLMTQLMTQLNGGAASRQIVDMTGIEGNYDASLDLSLAELLAMARAAGANIPSPPAGSDTPGANVPLASDPVGSGTSIAEAVQSMGLKLETRKATVEQLVVDHLDKAPTDN